MNFIEVTAIDGQTAHVVARTVIRIRPGLTQAGAKGLTRIEISGAHYHTSAALEDVFSALRDAEVTLVPLVDAAGHDIYANITAIGAIEDRTKRDPDDARGAVWIGGQRQTVRHTLEELRGLVTPKP